MLPRHLCHWSQLLHAIYWYHLIDSWVLSINTDSNESPLLFNQTTKNSGQHRTLMCILPQKQSQDDLGKQRHYLKKIRISKINLNTYSCQKKKKKPNINYNLIAMQIWLKCKVLDLLTNTVDSLTLFRNETKQ